MMQFMNFRIKNKKNEMCKLVETLYDLKQFFETWYNVFAIYLKELNFEVIIINFFIFINDIIIVVIYVNDVLFINFDKVEI